MQTDSWWTSDFESLHSSKDLQMMQNCGDKWLWVSGQLYSFTYDAKLQGQNHVWGTALYSIKGIYGMVAKLPEENFDFLQVISV